MNYFRKNESTEDVLRRIDARRFRHGGIRIDSDEPRFVEAIASLRASGALYQGIDINEARAKARAEAEAERLNFAQME